METKKVPDTPWHIGFIKKDESDPRRHKARCFYYQNGECHCVRSSYYTLKCPGSSHCSRYREDEETVQVIRNIQEERKRAEKYHELKIKMRIDLQNKLSEEELYLKYGKTLICPICSGRLINDECKYCGFTRPKMPKKKKQSDSQNLNRPEQRKASMIQKKLPGDSLYSSNRIKREVLLSKSKEESTKSFPESTITKIRYVENGNYCPLCKIPINNMKSINVIDKEENEQRISALVCEKCGSINLSRKLYKKLCLAQKDKTLNIINL